MKILVVASECVPFAKTGGLGDVISSLPIALNKLHINVRVIIPFYRHARYYFLQNPKHQLINNVLSFKISCPSEKAITKSYIAKIHRSTLQNSDVPIFFVDIPEFFDRSHIYVDETGKGFTDSAEIYAYFCKAVLKSMVLFKNKWFPEVIHANDWHTGLIPLFIKHGYVKIPKKVRTVFSIHNVAYQGKFSPSKIVELGFNTNKAMVKDLLHKNRKEKIGYLKSGIVCADIVTTVSRTYRDELLTPEYGFGLELHLQSRKSTFYGIMNGVDYTLWDPAKDPLIKKNYSPRDLQGKALCKKDLVEKFNLENGELPIIGMVTRLDHQKGIELIIKLLPKLQDLQAYIIIVGTGNKKFEAELTKLSAQLANFSLIIGFNNQLAHQIEAGSDLFLMPSKFEPCGLNQLYSLKYGTLPIVRSTGGLADSIIDIQDEENGNGFVFYEFNEVELEKTVRRAISFFTQIRNTENYFPLLTRLISTDFSWNKSALHYQRLYKELLP